MNPCPRCLTPVPGALARFCSRCGAALEEVDLTGSVPSPERSRGTERAPWGASQTEQGSPLAKVIVQEGHEVREVQLTARPLTIGRAGDNDLTLAAQYVSKKHCRIELEGASHYIVDEGSRNGLWHNGKRVERHALSHGDVVRISDPTTANFVAITYVAPVDARDAPGAVPVRHHALGDRPLVLGREGCDLELEHPQVSRRHARVIPHAGGHAIEDLGSTNGTWVDGTRVTRTHPLKAGSVVRVGPFKLVYDGRSLAQYDLRGAMRIHASGLWRVAGKGERAKVLLRDVSLSIEPREFVALVGGSGAGKSTLLGALSGYTRADRGTLLVNGEDYYARFDAWRASLGYVPQDDVLHRSLPVARALDYAARLRLPADTTEAEIAVRVARVLEAVEMTAHRDKVIENLSGGQRKRVSIAAELLADPQLFYLDEPTSGLDPGLEKKMMYTLRRLADDGRTVVLVTHATANITQCDLVAFLAAGRLVYYGPPSEALGFFNVTSGDFADIYSKLDAPADPGSPLVRGELRDEHRRWKEANPDHDEKSPPPSVAVLWELRFRDSPQHRRYVLERQGEAPVAPSAPPAALPGPRATPAGVSAWAQFKLLARRYVDLIRNDRKNLAVMLLQAPLIGALLLLAAERGALTGAQATAPEARKVLFMFATVAVWFGVINAAREIAKEVGIYRRERLATLRIGPYVLSKFLVLTALTLLQSAALLAVVRGGMAFPRNGVALLAVPEVLITTSLTAIAALSLGLFISAIAATPDKATSAVPLALIPQILFAGNIFKLEGAAEVLSWATIARWSFNAYGSTVDVNHLPWSPGGRTMAAWGLAEDAFLTTNRHLLECWGALGLHAVGALGLTALVLKLRDRG